VSEPLHPAPPEDVPAGAEEVEEMDALPVLSGVPRVVPAQPGPGARPVERRGAALALPAVQAAAVAAGGFVAGAALVRLLRGRRRRSAALSRRRRAGQDRSRRARRAARAGELVQIVGSRSLLLDVHLLGGADDR
jgi:hypothetical protein